MEMSGILSLLQESIYLIVVFFGFLFFMMYRGTQTVINLILALYLGLLLSLEFPYYEPLLAGAGSSPKTESIILICVFIFFTFLAKLLFNRLMRPDDFEKTFENFWQKILYASAATVLVMIYTYHALPITEFIEPGSPIQYLFGSEQSFFYWLLFPLIILFLL